jgi:LacI family transcriptional regulator
LKSISEIDFKVCPGDARRGLWRLLREAHTVTDKRKLTIKDVALEAGVSVATVSRVLNGYKHIRPGVRQRVAAAIRELDFEPDRLARSLRVQATGTVGFVVRDIVDPLFATMAQGVDEELQAHGYTMFLSTSGGDALRDCQSIELLRQRRVDGFILAVSDETSPALHDILGKLTVPVVLLDRASAEVRVDSVATDYRPGFRDAVARLADLGHQRIAYVGGLMTILPGRERLTAFSDAMAAASREVDPSLVRVGSFSQEHGAAAAAEVLAQRPPPTAIFAAGYQIAVGVLQHLHERSLRVPDDLSLVCNDDGDLMRFGNPSVSAVLRPLAEIGRRAAALLVERMTGSDTDDPGRQIRVPTTFVDRASCAPVEGGR